MLHLNLLELGILDLFLGAADIEALDETLQGADKDILCFFALFPTQLGQVLLIERPVFALPRSFSLGRRVALGLAELLPLLGHDLIKVARRNFFVVS